VCVWRPIFSTISKAIIHHLSTAMSALQLRSAFGPSFKIWMLRQRLCPAHDQGPRSTWSGMRLQPPEQHQRDALVQSLPTYHWDVVGCARGRAPRISVTIQFCPTFCRTRTCTCTCTRIWAQTHMGMHTHTHTSCRSLHRRVLSQARPSRGPCTGVGAGRWGCRAW